MSHRDDKPGSVAPLLSIGAGMVAGWMLRKFLQKKYNETINNKTSSSASDKQLISQVFGKYSQQASNYYSEVRQNLLHRVDGLASTAKEVDLKKYKQLVEDALADVRDEQKVPKAHVDALRAYLLDDWQNIKAELQSQSAENLKDKTKVAIKRTTTKAKKAAADVKKAAK